MKNIKHLLMALALMGSSAAMAEGYLTINGKPATPADNATSIEFDGDNALITFADNTTATLPLYQIMISADPSATPVSGISINVMIAQNTVSQTLTIGGTEGGESIAVYDIMGRLVSRSTADANETTISTAGLKGMYIVAVGNNVVKIVVK